jgi:SAM-dependent methyltransferase
MLTDQQDAYGHALLDYLNHKGGFEIVERDDGYFSLSGGPEHYFREYEQWPTSEQKPMAYVHGRVLDIGCGAGRHALYLQEQGHPVTGIDISPLAIDVCKARGLHDARVLPITKISQRLGIYDTIIMMGNNFGLFSSHKRAKWLLSRFRSITSENATIIAQSRDPYKTDDPDHLEYHASNRVRGRMSGQVRLRVRYKRYVTPWFDYLMVSKDEMHDILEGTGWSVKKYFEEQDLFYTAIIGKNK